MGTCYKGKSKYFRSIGQNILLASSTYHFANGYFGIKSGHSIRNIVSKNPLSTSIDFYEKISLGGIETISNGGKLRITRMADGTVITMRTTSHSDGTPAVQINITKSTHHSEIKQQKIHFVEEK